MGKVGNKELWEDQLYSVASLGVIPIWQSSCDCLRIEILEANMLASWKVRALEGEIIVPQCPWRWEDSYIYLFCTGGLSSEKFPFHILSAPVRSVSVKSKLLAQDMSYSQRQGQPNQVRTMQD